jgi:hypothetical protein
MDRVSISPSTTKKITAVSPMETDGQPDVIRPTSTAKIAAVIIENPQDAEGALHGARVA